MAKVAFEVGYTFPRGRQPMFAPYGQYNSYGYIGTGPLWQQPGRYPLPTSTKIQTTALSRESAIGTELARTHPGLADPGLGNSRALSQPLGNDPAVRGQQLAMRARPSSDSYDPQLSAMQIMKR